MLEPDTSPRENAAIGTRLTSLFASVLDVDEVGPDDDFFELGGDSLAVIRLVARVRQHLSVEIAPGDVFDHPTVSSLVRFLAQQRG